jgi:hypothetical protein
MRITAFLLLGPFSCAGAILPLPACSDVHGLLLGRAAAPQGSRLAVACRTAHWHRTTFAASGRHAEALVLVLDPAMRVAFIAALIVCTTPAASAASVSDVFEQYGLLGAFAVDCTRPVSPQNFYTHFRALKGGRVKIELMVGPQQRQYAYVIDRAEVRGPNEVAISMANQQQRLISSIACRTAACAPWNRRGRTGRWLSGAARSPPTGG